MPGKVQDDDLVMRLVELALAQPPGVRETYVRTACGGDSELFSSVWDYVQWDERMQDFLLEPLFPPPSLEHPFEDGDVLEGRFRIVREVAQGGMGVVYEAFDQKLERRIALKCAKTGYRQRLPPEVRHAREISHPNVCKIFEIHTASTGQGDIDFLTMEFLEGETLSERLQRGRVPEPEARAIALQLCAGLAEAHRHHVIHGDLKSNNVILTKDRDGAVRAVITDFGLAREPLARIADLPRQTGPSELVGGAPDYMAPELYRGEKNSVASDIYALGVMLYELASGRRPFGPEVTWEQRLTLQPPRVHSKWNRILTRCLNPDPAGRFRSAEQVAQAIVPPHTRTWILGAAAAAAVLSIATGAVTYERATAPKELVRLAMLPIGSSGDTAELAANMSRDTAKQMARLRGGSAARLVFIAPAEARSTAGATHLLNASLAKENGKLWLRAALIDARSGVHTKDWTAVYAPGEERYIPVALAGMVTASLKLPPLAMAARLNSAASNDYWAGLWYTRQNSTLAEALRSLQKAVAKDPDSPLTYAALAEAQWFEYFLTKDQVWLNHARESVQIAESRNPDTAAAHRVEGYLLYAGGLYDKAVAEFDRSIALQPGSATAYIWLGKAYEDNDQLDRALTAFQKATEVEPRYFRTYQNLGAFYQQRSNFSEAITYLNKAVELAPQETSLHYALGVVYMDLGRFAEAEEQLRYALGLGETASVVHALGLTLMYQSRDQEAIPYFLRALALESPGGTPQALSLMYLAIAYRRCNQVVEAKQTNQRGLEVAEADMARNPRDGYSRAFLAYFSAVLKDRDRAVSEIAQALRLRPDDSDTRWRAILTYEELGLRDKTIELLRSSTGDQLADLSRWPDLAGLHKDSRVSELLTSH